MGGITGWDKGLGTLLGLWFKDQAQRKQEETLRQLLEDQQRQMTNTQIQGGLAQGPVEPPGARTPPAPPPQRSFVDYLQNIPGDIGEALTGGPQELTKLKEQYAQGGEDLAQQKTLADWWQHQQMANQLPLGVGEKEKLGLQEKLRQQEVERQQQWDLKMRGVPQATAPGFDERLFGNMTPEQKQQFVQRKIQGEPSFTEQMFNSMTPEQKAQYQNKLAGGAGGIGDLTPAQQNAAFKLADDYARDSKNFFTVQDSVSRIRQAAQDPNPAANLALIFSYMKLLDPTSVVREGEQASAQNAAAVPARIRNTYNAVLNGDKIPPEARADFLNQAEKIFQSSMGQQQRVQDLYSTRATQYKIPPNMVVRDLGTAAPTSPPDVKASRVVGAQVPSGIPGTTAAPATAAGRSVRIEEGALKGMVIDSKAAYDELKRKGVITGKEKVSIEAQ